MRCTTQATPCAARQPRYRTTARRRSLKCQGAPCSAAACSPAVRGTTRPQVGQPTIGSHRRRRPVAGAVLAPGHQRGPAAATLDGTGWPDQDSATNPATATSLTRSMPEASPSSTFTKSSVARLPPAPGANGEPPRPPTAVSKRRTPRSGLPRRSPSAEPRVSCRCRPTSVAGTGSAASTSGRAGAWRCRSCRRR